MPDRAYWTVQDVAAHFGINPTTVYHMARRGALPGFKVGTQWRFSKRMLDSWVADQVTLEWLKADGARPPRERDGDG